jgi:hypothetical protein
LLGVYGDVYPNQDKKNLKKAKSKAVSKKKCSKQIL